MDGETLPAEVVALVVLVQLLQGGLQLRDGRGGGIFTRCRPHVSQFNGFSQKKKKKKSRK